MFWYTKEIKQIKKNVKLIKRKTGTVQKSALEWAKAIGPISNPAQKTAELGTELCLCLGLCVLCLTL